MATQTRPQAQLLIKNGGFAGMTYDLVADETIIGRNPTTDITLLDEGISREHAIITYDPTDRSYSIEDLQSTNGMKINGKRARSSALSNGDEIQLGGSRFNFALTGG